MIASDGIGGNLRPVVRCGWFWWLVVSTAVITAALVLEFRAPDAIVIPLVELALPTTCWTRRWLGFNCPGCGLTRSFVIAAHGDFSRAFVVHPIGAFAFGLLVLQLPLRILQGWQFLVNRRNNLASTGLANTGFVGWFSNGKSAVGVLAVVAALSFLWWVWNLAPTGNL